MLTKSVIKGVKKVIECQEGNNNVKWVEKLTKSMHTKLMTVYVAVCLYHKTLKDKDIILYLEINIDVNISWRFYQYQLIQILLIIKYGTNIKKKALISLMYLII